MIIILKYCPIQHTTTYVNQTIILSVSYSKYIEILYILYIMYVYGISLSTSAYHWLYVMINIHSTYTTSVIHVTIAM